MKSSRLTATLLAALAAPLFLGACSSLMPETPYFGEKDHNNRFVPYELHEEETD